MPTAWAGNNVPGVERTVLALAAVYIIRHDVLMFVFGTIAFAVGNNGIGDAGNSGCSGGDGGSGSVVCSGARNLT